jgi:hypothetical protein
MHSYTVLWNVAVTRDTEATNLIDDDVVLASESDVQQKVIMPLLTGERVPEHSIYQRANEALSCADFSR